MTTNNDENTAQDPEWLCRLRSLLSHEEYRELAIRVISLRAATDVLEDAIAALRRSCSDDQAETWISDGDKWIRRPGGQENECPLPPQGWFCTRVVGHDGPCAAMEFETETTAPKVGDGDSPALKAANGALDDIASICGFSNSNDLGEVVRAVQEMRSERLSAWARNDALARELADLEELEPFKKLEDCGDAPPGWPCTRPKGHDGDCKDSSLIIDAVSPTAENHSPNETGLDLPPVVHGRDGLSRDAVADAIFAQQSQGAQVISEANRHIEDAAKVEIRITDPLLLPWEAAKGVYASDGPELPVTIRFCSAAIVVAPTEMAGIDSGRTRYRVHCETCDQELHRATTGTTSTLVGHLREKHGFAGEVNHAESK